MRSRLLALTCFALLWIPLLGVVTVQSTPAIHVFSCQVLSNDPPQLTQTDEIGLAVRFENTSPQDLTSIVFRAPYESGYVDFIDDGNFGRNVRVDNFVLFEAGKLKANVGNILGDLLNARNTWYAGQPMATANMTLPMFISSEDPGNCAIVRTIDKEGTLWLNPAVSQSPPPLAVPTPVPFHKRGEPTSPPTPTPPPDPNVPVAVYPCFLTVLGTSNSLNVRFANQSAKTMTDVVFRVPYGSGAIDFDDTGSFAPEVEINHHVRGAKIDALRGRMFMEPNTPQQCVPVRATFADGTAWKNPAIAGPAVPPTPIPDMLVMPAPAWTHWTSRHTFPTPLPSPSATPA